MKLRTEWTEESAYLDAAEMIRSKELLALIGNVSPFPVKQVNNDISSMYARVHVKTNHFTYIKQQLRAIS